MLDLPPPGLNEVRTMRSFLDRELGSLLDVDDGARYAGLAVEQGQLASEASGYHGAGCIAFGIAPPRGACPRIEPSSSRRDNAVEPWASAPLDPVRQ